MAARNKALQEGIVQYDEASSSFQCVVCKSPLSGTASVDQHLDGSKHREAGVRYAIANIDNCPSSLKSILSPNCITAVKNGVICSTGGHAQRCTVCSVALTGIGQIEDHLIGEDHRKKSEKQRLCGVPSPVVPFSVGATANLGQLARQPQPHAAQLAHSFQSLRVAEPAPYVSQPAGYAAPGAPTYTTGAESYAPRILTYAPGAPTYAPAAAAYEPAAQFGAPYPAAAAAAVTGRDTTFTLRPSPLGSDAPLMYASPPATIQPAARPDASMIEEAMANGLVIETDNVSEPFLCSICNKKFNSSHTLYDHLKSIKHKKKENDNLQRQMSSPLASNASSNLLFLPESANGRGREVYRVASTPRGHVYVFNYKFLGSKLQRNGAEKDSQNLNETFSRMGYEVFIFEDLTREETLTTLTTIRKKANLSEIDAFVLFLLSHGKDRDTLYTNDQKNISLLDIRMMFTNRQCPHLKGKPKIIFTNFCRGKYREQVEYDSVPSMEVPTDTITLYAVAEFISALRNSRGTHFVFCLCEVLRKFARELELQDLYSELYKEMKVQKGTSPMIESHGFIKKFYFNPS